jgi:hypothetical protein
MARTMVSEMYGREARCVEDTAKRLNLVQCKFSLCEASDSMLTYLLRSSGLVSSSIASFACS